MSPEFLHGRVNVPRRGSFGRYVDGLGDNESSFGGPLRVVLYCQVGYGKFTVRCYLLLSESWEPLQCDGVSLVGLLDGFGKDDSSLLMNMLNNSRL